MSAPAAVLDVVPPPVLPAVRPRSRPVAGLFVGLVVFLVASLGMVVAAPPAAALVQLAAPIAAGALRIAPSVVKVVTGKTVMTPTVGALGGGLALAVAGAFGNPDAPVEGEDEESHWDDDAIWKKLGIKMPWDMEAEAAEPPSSQPPKPPNQYVNSEVTVKRLEWTTIDYAGKAMQTLRLEVGCSKAGNPDRCPANATDAFVATGVTVRAKCVDPARPDTWYTQILPFQANARQRDSVGVPPCVRSAGLPVNLQVQDPLSSLEVLNPATGTSVSFVVTNPEQYMNPEFDPTTATPPTITGSAQCANPATGESRTVTNVSQIGGVLPGVQCPPGWTPQSIGWTSTYADGTSKNLGGAQYDFTEFPACADMSCVLRVTVDGVPCRVGIDVCYDWNKVEPKSRVACEYGPYAVGLDQCRDLAGGYRTTPGLTPGPAAPNQPQPKPNAPSNPEVPKPTRLVPSDPEGRPAPHLVPDGAPRPDPYPPTAPNPNPSTTVQPSPSPSPTAPPTAGVPPPVAIPPGSGPPDVENPYKQCIAGMASWNPVDWVYTPVKCALTWAFVPKNGRGGQLFGEFRQKFVDSGIGPWLSVPPDLFEDLPQGGGCQGPALTMPASLGGKTYYPLNACSDPMAKYANMSRSLITVVVVFFGMFSVINSLTTSLTGYRMFERESAQVTKGMT